jgi:hypothetical protein
LTGAAAKIRKAPETNEKEARCIGAKIGAIVLFILQREGLAIDAINNARKRVCYQTAVKRTCLHY